MGSQDVLDKLFETERKAESMVAEAKAVSSRRIAEAKQRGEVAYQEALEIANKAAIENRKHAAERAEAEYKGALDSYRNLLETTPVDERAFTEACETGLHGKD